MRDTPHFMDRSDGGDHAGRRPYDVVVMSASAGGLAALIEILPHLPEDFPIPIVVVMHHGAGRSQNVVDILARRTKLSVVAAVDGDRLEPGVIYLAPASRHMLLADHRIASMDGRQINYLRSSSEPLLGSVVSAFGSRAIAVILTGSGRNGAFGARALHDAGGMVLVQDPKTAEALGMPLAAIEAGAANEVVPLKLIGPRLVELTRTPAMEP